MKQLFSTYLLTQKEISTQKLIEYETVIQQLKKKVLTVEEKLFKEDFETYRHLLIKTETNNDKYYIPNLKEIKLEIKRGTYSNPITGTNTPSDKETKTEQILPYKLEEGTSTSIFSKIKSLVTIQTDSSSEEYDNPSDKEEDKKKHHVRFK